MSEILKVLNRKSVELKSEVVEFNLIKDLRSGLDKALTKFDSEHNKAKEAAYRISDTGDLFKKLEKEASNAQNMAKELGVDSKDIDFVLEESKRMQKVALAVAKGILRG
jgi:mevalonate kinase